MLGRTTMNQGPGLSPDYTPGKWQSHPAHGEIPGIGPAWDRYRAGAPIRPLPISESGVADTIGGDNNPARNNPTDTPPQSSGFGSPLIPQALARFPSLGGGHRGTLGVWGRRRYHWLCPFQKGAAAGLGLARCLRAHLPPVIGAENSPASRVLHARHMLCMSGRRVRRSALSLAKPCIYEYPYERTFKTRVAELRAGTGAERITQQSAIASVSNHGFHSCGSAETTHCHWSDTPTTSILTLF